MSARLARVALIFALLAGWQAALQHPLEHLDEHGEFVHLGHDQDRSPGSLCDLLDALTACVSNVAVALQATDVFQAVLVPQVGELRLAEAPPFLSQGPPALL